MKRTCFLLCSWLLAITAALACEVTFDATLDVGTSNGVAGPFYMDKDCITVTFSYGLANSMHYRIYKGQNITICSSEGNITGIEFECTANDDAQYGPGCFVVDGGTYTYSGKIGSWEGNQTCVTFTAVTNQVRIIRIVVTYDCGGLSKPAITPPSGRYYGPIQVSMNCNTPGATIHYTIDGTDPTANSTQYTEPFNLSEDATVKAISALDGEVSEVVTATYEFATANQIECLGDAITLPDGEAAIFPNPITVVFQHGNYLFVKDDCAHALIYGNCGQTYAQGDIIPGGFILTKQTYNGEPEFNQPENFRPSIGNVPIEPEELTTALGHELFAHYVLIRDARIEKQGNQYYVIDPNGNVYPIYFGSLGVTPPIDLECLYDVYAIVGSYGRENTIYQLLAVKLVRKQEFTLCDVSNIPDDEIVSFDHEATVIYQYNRYLYLMDECGFGLVYGDVGQTYHTGDIIPPGWGGIKTTYNCEPEIKNPTGFQPACRNEEVLPMLITIPQVGHPLWAHYVELHGVYIDQENMVIRDQDGNTCPYYPQLPYQVSPAIPLDIRAIITSYGRTEPIYQLFIISTSYIIPPPPGACCLSDLYENSNKNEVTEFICPLTVIYQKSPYLYVKDSCDDYGLIYGSGIGPFENGDQIIGSASWTTYQNAYQLTPELDWHIVGRTDPVEPIEIPIEEISYDMVHWYVRIKDATISFDDNTLTVADETGTMTMFDRFDAEIIDYWEHVCYPCDVNWDNEVNIADVNCLINAILNGLTDAPYHGFTPDDVDPDATYDVDGFISIYKNQLEIFPIRITRYGTLPPPPFHDRFDVNGDGEVTIADVNCIIDFILNH